jgi:DNA-binding IclR family transcriptional regulator
MTATTIEASSSFFERLSTTTPPRRRRRSRGEGRRRPGGECVAVVVVGKSAILSLTLSLSSALTRVNAQKKEAAAAETHKKDCA